MNAGWWLGWLAGMALAVVVGMLLPQLGLIGGILLGFGLSQIGGFIGMKAYR